MSLNVSIIGGRLGKDPELKETKSGTKVCEISVAVDNGFGEKKSTAWVKVVAWGKTAEFVHKYFVKGKPIVVHGRLDEDKWKDKDTGKDRSRLFITADKVDFAMSDKGEQGAPRETAPSTAQSTQTQDYSDDIPF